MPNNCQKHPNSWIGLNGPGFCQQCAREREANDRLALTAGSEVFAGDGYRLLKPGERLQKHDEGLHEEDNLWHEVGWLFSACDYVPGFMVPIRRKIDPQNRRW